MLQQETETEVASSGAEGETSEADSLAAKSFDQYLACQEKAVHLSSTSQNLSVTDPFSSERECMLNLHHTL